MHDKSKRNEARTLYVYKNCEFKDIERIAKIPDKTIRRWKDRALKKDGDDWDKARHIVNLSEQTAGAINRQVYAQWLSKFKEVQEKLLSPKDIDIMTRVAALASLADSFSKMIAAMRKIEPEVNVASTALTVLETIADYLNEADEGLARKFAEHIDAIGLKIQHKFAA